MDYFLAGKNNIYQNHFSNSKIVVAEMFKSFLNKKLMIVVNVVPIHSMVLNPLCQIILSIFSDVITHRLV